MNRNIPDSLAVAVVTYNSADHLEALLDSLPAAAGSLTLSVLVVDNASSDDSVAVARRYPGVQVIQTGANLGYSGAINVARDHFGHTNLAILNPDLTLGPKCLEVLVHGLRGTVGISVPKLTAPDGEVFRDLRRESSVHGALGDAVFGDHWPMRPRWLTDDLRRPSDYDEPREVAWAGGAAWVVSAECNDRVGRWDDETFFLYSEETDYARRARGLGFTVRYDSDAYAMHHGGGSGTSAALLALLSVNRVRYFERYNGPVRTACFRAAVVLGHMLRASSVSGHRYALGIVANRRRWSELPTAETRIDTSGRSA
ncbi:glycosyltransferase family 2 protein [Aldersonia sp. NBC_00410]|uniref:glycosyltransferase family 2 protein n=1 Tax=Aldersonia sp. NBC_00410 TaxID=2975954 RepID=UPI00224CD7E3|nr:glycosyltransferase family 2 protein [Aldersonia sp. NBC_00410]MCX5041678.1 glycosyltransferase family 2 protein [Aldersonia sp. NBC_00410]